MGIVILIGRILYAAIFIGSGIMGHLMQTEGTAGYAESRGVPNAKLLTQISGVLIALGGIAVILGIYLDLAALGLVAYTLIAAFMVHHFWTDQDPMAQQMEMTQFMKNLAIAGGGLILFALASLGEGGAVDFTLTDPLFDWTP